MAIPKKTLPQGPGKGCGFRLFHTKVVTRLLRLGFSFFDRAQRLFQLVPGTGVDIHFSDLALYLPQLELQLSATRCAGTFPV